MAYRPLCPSEHPTGPHGGTTWVSHRRPSVPRTSACADRSDKTFDLLLEMVQAECTLDADDEYDAQYAATQESWLNVPCRLLRSRTAPHRPPWTIWGLRPLPATARRRL